MPRPGWKTTEFWITLGTTVLGTVAASGLFGDSPVVKAMGLAVDVAAALGYTASRTAVKRSAWQQDPALLARVRREGERLFDTLGTSPGEEPRRPARPLPPSASPSADP